MKYRSKKTGAVIEAAQWSGGNSAEVAAVADHPLPWVHMTLNLSEHEQLELKPGDWLVKDPEYRFAGSQYYVASDDEFKKKFEESIVESTVSVISSVMVLEDMAGGKIKQPLTTVKVIVKATRQELHDMAICGGRSLELLLSGKPIKVDHEYTPKNGRTMVYLHPEYDKTPPILWVYKEFTEPYIE